METKGEFGRCKMVMPKACLALLGLLMLTLALSGCGVPQAKYDAVIAELTSSRSEIENLQDELNTPESEKIKNLQDELATQSATLAQIQNSNTALQEQISGLENELDVVFNTTVTFDYQFETSKGNEHNWTLTIPLRDYFYYKGRPRPSWSKYSSMVAGPYYYFKEYGFMVTDPYDDDIINSIVRQLNEEASTEDLSDLDKVSLVLRFVQNLTYTEDVDTTPFDEYPRYPVETLFDRGGDCEDTSILVAAILTAIDYDVALLLFEEYDHMGVGINIPLGYGNSWIHDGKRYWYLETTGGRSVGWAPTVYQETAAYVYPVGR